MLAALGRPDLADDLRFTDVTARMQHAAELIAEFDAAFATRPMSEWAARFGEHDVWLAPVQSIPDVTPTRRRSRIRRDDAA